MATPLRAATRSSHLALRQVDLVEERLGRPLQRVIVSTTGDRVQDRPLHEIGGQGVFVKEVQAAVLEGAADIAVHSAKDLPSSSPPGLCIAAVLPRGDVRDALVGATINALCPGARVATGSVRRAAQLTSLRPDLTIVPLRGNIETRLSRLAEVDAILMAAVALDRTGLPWHGERLHPTTMIPQVGQGAIAVECNSEDHRTRSAVAAVDAPPSHAALRAERAFLRVFGEGCDLPVGAFAHTVRGHIDLVGFVCAKDGRIVRGRLRDRADLRVGERLARKLQAAAHGLRQSHLPADTSISKMKRHTL